jgi:hypothetical protein
MHGAYMSENLLHKLPMLSIVESRIKTEETPATFQTVSGHFELIHGMDVLDVHFDARPIGRFGCPHVEVFMPSRFKI